MEARRLGHLERIVVDALSCLWYAVVVLTFGHMLTSTGLKMKKFQSLLNYTYSCNLYAM